MKRLWLVMALLVCCPAALAQIETVEDRMGKSYWARPALSETSVEFHADATLRARAPVRDKVRFRIVGVKPGGPWPSRDPVYAVQFDDGHHAFIDARDFERRLYRELQPNEVSTSPLFAPPLGRGVQVYQFERASIFTADPDVMWARIRNQGPRTFQPGAPATSPQAPPAPPTIAPR